MQLFFIKLPCYAFIYNLFRKTENICFLYEISQKIWSENVDSRSEFKILEIKLIWNSLPIKMMQMNIINITVATVPCINHQP